MPVRRQWATDSYSEYRSYVEEVYRQAGAMEEIKRIPEVLEDPVMILKSKGNGRGGNSRLIAFGAVKAQN